MQLRCDTRFFDKAISAVKLHLPTHLIFEEPKVVVLQLPDRLGHQEELVLHTLFIKFKFHVAVHTPHVVSARYAGNVRVAHRFIALLPALTGRVMDMVHVCHTFSAPLPLSFPVPI